MMVGFIYKMRSQKLNGAQKIIFIIFFLWDFFYVGKYLLKLFCAIIGIELL